MQHEPTKNGFELKCSQLFTFPFVIIDFNVDLEWDTHTSYVGNLQWETETFLIVSSSTNSRNISTIGVCRFTREHQI